MPKQDKSPLQQIDIPVRGMHFTANVCGPEGGIPVLLLHGFPQTRHAWTKQLNFLGNRGYRAVAPDQRGYSPGARPLGAGAYALEELLADIQAFIGSIGARKAHLVGTDWGGQLAWFAAARFPERIATLSVLSRPHPLAHRDALERDPYQAARSAHHQSLLEPGAAELWREDDLAEPRRRFRNGSVPSEVINDYLSVIREPGALEAAIEWYVAAAKRPPLTEFPPITVPVLYVCGTEDHAVGRYARERTMHYVLKDFQYVEVEGGTHYLSDASPDLINELLIAHFEKYS